MEPCRAWLLRPPPDLRGESLRAALLFRLASERSTPSDGNAGDLQAGSVPDPLEAGLATLLARVLALGIRPIPPAAPPPAPLPPPCWMTPPEAARTTGIPVKAIRSFIRSRRIEVRLRNTAANPRQRKYLVNVAEVVRLATVPSRPSDPGARMELVPRRPEPVSSEDWVRSRLGPPGR